MTQFGNNLLYIMRIKDISQKELAIKIGVTEATMSRYITNKREPKVDIIVKIAKALNISADKLLGIDEEFAGEPIKTGDVIRINNIKLPKELEELNDYNNKIRNDFQELMYSADSLLMHLKENNKDFIDKDVEERIKRIKGRICTNKDRISTLIYVMNYNIHKSQDKVRS